MYAVPDVDARTAELVAAGVRPVAARRRAFAEAEAWLDEQHRESGWRAEGGRRSGWNLPPLDAADPAGCAYAQGRADQAAGTVDTDRTDREYVRGLDDQRADADMEIRCLKCGGLHHEDNHAEAIELD